MRKQVYRYFIVAAIFCAVCVVYLAQLFGAQIAGRESTYATGTTTRTVTVQAMRGEIYDRNGEKLVGNAYTYDLILSFSGIHATPPQTACKAVMVALESLDACGESGKHTEKYFPLEGTYPNYTYAEDAKNEETAVGYRLARVLSDRGMKATASATDLVNAYVSEWNMLCKDENNRRVFNDGDVDRLIRFFYDTDAKRFQTTGEYTVAQNVSKSVMACVLEQGNLPGVTFEVNAERVYLYPGYASHVLGMVGPIWSEEWDYYNEQGYQMSAIVGKSGCELAFESYLRGTDGEMEITEDSAGNILSVKMKKEPIAGSDVYLTIDINLQIAAEDGLAETVAYVAENDRDGVEGFLCDAGAAVVMDPETFDVLAIASYPSYDLSTYNLSYNDLLQNTANPLLNRALQGTYAPGSTFKLGVAVAGLMNGTITPSTTFYCGGSYNNAAIPKDHPGCSTYPHATAYLNVVQAIAESCNCFFYELGYRLGIETLDTYMKNFGFGEGTGIELGESTGSLAGPAYRHAPYTTGEVVRSAIGQSDNQATPLQLCSYLSTLYNGGTRYQAHLLGEVKNFATGEVLYSDDALLSEPLSSVEISETAYNTVFSGMTSMVQSTAFVRARLAGLGLGEIGAKTGTAEVTKTVTNPETGETELVNVTNALFVCAAEYKNEKITVTVVIEKAAHGYYDAIAARSILSAWKTSIDGGNA